MERSEPALVPEWLRCPGNATGRGSSPHHIVSPSLHLDDSSSSHSTKTRPSRSTSNKDIPHSMFLDRTSSLHSRRSTSSNGSTKHPSSSFTRSNRDRNCDKDKSVIGELWDHECSDPFDGILSKVDKIIFRRSQSLVSRKAGEVLPRGDIDFRNGISSSNNSNSGNGFLSCGCNTSGTRKAAFEKDFPSLVSEEKQGGYDTAKIPSPGLSTAVQSLQVGIGMIGNEKWTSALAEVPVNISSSSVGQSSVQKSIAATPLPGSSSTMAGLNMAEALSQASFRAHLTPQVPNKTHRLEELAIKQSKQLIPMIPSTPKASVLSSSDKLKQPKTVRTGEITTTKTVQQQPNSSLPANQSVRGGQKSDASKSSHVGKFLVLKPVRENGVSSTAKDVSALTNSSSGEAHGQLAVATYSPTASSTMSNGPKLSTVECKAAAMALNLSSIKEKRPSITQAQSRSDFFNLIRNKTLASSSSLPDSSLAVGSPAMEESGYTIEVVSASMCQDEDLHKTPNNVDTYEEYQGVRLDGEKDLSIDRAVYPDEEETAFLRSLGWDENGGEDEGLTEEEINAFYQEYMKLRPSFKVCQGAEPKDAVVLESQTSNSVRRSSQLSLLNS